MIMNRSVDAGAALSAKKRRLIEYLKAKIKWIGQFQLYPNVSHLLYYLDRLKNLVATNNTPATTKIADIRKRATSNRISRRK